MNPSTEDEHRKQELVLSQLVQLQSKFDHLATQHQHQQPHHHGSTGTPTSSRAEPPRITSIHLHNLREVKQLDAIRQPLYDARKTLVALVDRFWLHVLLANPTTFRRIMKDDVEPLSYLEHVQVAWDTETSIEHERLGAIHDRRDAQISRMGSSSVARSMSMKGNAPITSHPDGTVVGYTIYFEFSENEWFSNKYLYKRVRYLAGNKNVTSSNIQWRPDKCLTSTDMDGLFGLENAANARSLSKAPKSPSPTSPHASAAVLQTEPERPVKSSNEPIGVGSGSNATLSSLAAMLDADWSGSSSPFIPSVSSSLPVPSFFSWFEQDLYLDEDDEILDEFVVDLYPNALYYYLRDITQGSNMSDGT